MGKARNLARLIVDSSGGLDAGNIPDGSVTTAKIAAGAVATADIADTAVTTVKIADSAITTGKIADGAVATADIADSAVTTAKIANANVTVAKISATGTPSSTTFLAGDGSWQAISTSPPTTLYAIGTYVMGRPQNTTGYAVNSTIAGTSLYATSGGAYYVTAGCNPGWQVAGQTLVNTGTWRCMSPAMSLGSGQQSFAGLWVRIS